MVRHSKAPRRPRPSLARRIFRGVLFAVLLVIVALVSLLAGFYVGLSRSLPALVLTEEISSAQTTKIYDSSDSAVLLADLHGPENRVALSIEQVPKVMRDAVVAVEDERFYEHSGIDFMAILRALWANVTHGEIVEGGSTITQQLVKNAFITDEQTLNRKVREAALAYQLEKRWSKEKILTEYLNLIYFGEGAYGIEAAALAYFGVHATDLTLDQAALLAGLPRSPSASSPRRDPEAALARRDVVLNKMYQQGYITSDQLQDALSAPLELAETGANTTARVPYWIEMVREQLVTRYGSSTVLAGGLRVYTSIDLSLQQAAEEAVAQILDQPGDPSAALVCIDVKTGRMLAMVGGADFTQLQFNLATQGRRQPGSAFKPFVLVTALEQGMSPDSTYESGPITIDLPSGPWKVSSTDHGLLTLAQATAQSSNGVYARLIMDLGADAVAQTAYDLGIVTSLGERPNPAIALGGLTEGVSPLEMAMAYTTLATGGERLSSQVFVDPLHAVYPVTITRVTDSAGNVLDEDQASRTRVLDPGLAAIATTCLEQVIASGTGTAADIGRPAAGKTGTTQNYSDAWFVGYTPELVTAVWVGCPDAQTPMTEVHGIKVTGGSLPAQIWAAFMQRALADVPVSEFPVVEGSEWVSVEVCGDSHLLPTEYCPNVVAMLFRPDEQPTDTCAAHVAQEVAVPNVVDLTFEEAEAALKSVHFLASRSDDPLSAEPAGTITAQDPGGGAKLLQGSTVILHVSTGEGAITVPSLTGLDIAVARTKLANLGLVIRESSVSDESPAGTVLSQDPPPGTTVSLGSTITVLVSIGPTAASVP